VSAPRFGARPPGQTRGRLAHVERRRAACALAIAGLLQTQAAPARCERPSHRLILVSLDGASAAVMDDAVARGVMPHLARLRARGSTARGAVSSLPATTAAGHAALFTGTYASGDGISGNEVPAPGGTVLDSVSGFTTVPLTAEPIWSAAARQGLRATVLSAPQVYPFKPSQDETSCERAVDSRLLLLDGYENRDLPEALLTAGDIHLTPAVGWQGPLPPHRGEARGFRLSVGSSSVEGLVYDDPEDPVSGFDTVYLSLDKRTHGGITLKPLPSRPNSSGFQNLRVEARAGLLDVPFRLFALSPRGDDIILYHAACRFQRSSRPGLERVVLGATGGFTGNGAHRLYEHGLLGRALWDGGDGTAESRYLETARCAAERFGRLVRFGVESTRWDLLVTYLPFPDEMLHMWLARLDPALPGHDPVLAARLRPFVDEALRCVDEYVGHIARLAGPGTILAVASDHGFVSSDREIAFNVALRKAGLLALTDDGRVDLAHTRAVYFPGNSGYFLVNATSRTQGIVPSAERGAVLRELQGVLEALRDPDTGAPVVSEVLSDEEVLALGGGGSSGGDLYIRLAPRYFPSARTSGDLVARTAPHSVHMLDPQAPEMYASFTIAGPGVAAATDLGIIRQIDIAPTLCALLGIGPPAQATGRVIEAALAPHHARSLRHPLVDALGGPASRQ